MDMGVSPVRPKVPEEVCTGCHDEYNSPNFDYDRYRSMGGDHGAAKAGESSK